MVVNIIGARPFVVWVNYVDIYGNAQAVTLRNVLARDVQGAIEAARGHFLASHKARVMGVQESLPPPTPTQGETP